MKELKFTLIIGIDHNDKNYTDTLRQAQSQDYTNLEIIVVSNRLNEKEQIILDHFIHQDDLREVSTFHFSIVNVSQHYLTKELLAQLVITSGASTLKLFSKTNQQ